MKHTDNLLGTSYLNEKYTKKDIATVHDDTYPVIPARLQPMNILLRFQSGRGVSRWMLLCFAFSFQHLIYNMAWEALFHVHPIRSCPPPSFLFELPVHAHHPAPADDLPRVMDLDFARACVELADGKIPDVSIREERFPRLCYGLVGERKYLLLCEAKGGFSLITNAVLISCWTRQYGQQ